MKKTLLILIGLLAIGSAKAQEDTTLVVSGAYVGEWNSAPIMYAANTQYSVTTPDGRTLYQVRAVHDGDSYRIKRADWEWLRGEGLDCPELFSPYVSKEQPYGRAIGDSVRALLKTQYVEIKTYGLDRHGRTRAQVFLNGQDIAEIILKRGWGWYESNNKLPRETKRKYRDHVAYAKANKLGLWASDETPVRPSEWRKQHPPIEVPKI